MEPDLAWRWRDHLSVVHRVLQAGHGWRHGGPWFYPACRACDPTIVWPKPKQSPLPVNCMTCLVMDARRQQT